MEQEPSKPESQSTDSQDPDEYQALVDRAVKSASMIQVMAHMTALNKPEKRIVRFMVRNPDSNLLLILVLAIMVFNLLVTIIAFMLFWNNVVSDFLQSNLHVNSAQALSAMGLLAFLPILTLSSKEQAWSKAYMLAHPNFQDTAEQKYYHDLQISARTFWYNLRWCLVSSMLALIIILAVTFI